MNLPGFLVHLLGLGLVLAGLWLVYERAGLARWIPWAVSLFVLLLVAGVGIMAAADKLREGEATVATRVVEERRYD